MWAYGFITKKLQMLVQINIYESLNILNTKLANIGWIFWKFRLVKFGVFKIEFEYTGYIFYASILFSNFLKMTMFSMDLAKNPLVR
jgi:hypothetical protein